MYVCVCVCVVGGGGSRRLCIRMYIYTHTAKQRFELFREKKELTRAAHILL